MEYEIIYSDRRTLAISIVDGSVVVRAPYGMSRSRIQHYVSGNSGWIEKHLSKSIARMQKERVSDAEVRSLKKDAKKYFIDTVARFSTIMGLKPGRVTITSAKKRFGSCSSNGNICFSYRLMLYPEEAREYVVVHELAHLVELNHSPAFYGIVERYMPDYKKREKLLE